MILEDISFNVIKTNPFSYYNYRIIKINKYYIFYAISSLKML